MADQKIKLQVGADTSELMAALDQVVKKTQQVQNQLKSLTAPRQPTASPEERKYQQVLGDVRKEEEKAKVSKGAQDIAKKQLQDIRREIEANGRAEAKNEKDREQSQRNINRLKEEERRISETLNRLQGKTADGRPAPSTARGGMPAGGITSMGGLASAIGVPGMVMGGIATAAFALKTGESIRRAIAEAQYEARATQTQAFNTKGQGGQLLESAITGNGLEDLMFSGERARGQQTGEGLVNRRYQPSGAIGGIALKGLSYAFPEAGRRANNSIGALEHGQFSQAANALFRPDIYQQNLSLERAQEGATQTEIEKNAPENKARSVIKEQYDQEYQRNLAFQRQTGFTENEFRNFNIANGTAGFTQQQGMEASSAISGAGGGTRNARNNATFALQMGRQFDLTNAGQAIGSLGGQLGSSQLTKDALIKVQAEGTRIGLNQSEFREENRKFVEMASAAIGQSSVTSKEGVGDILETFGKFMNGANTTQSLAAGKTAYDAYQAQSKSQSGPEAVLRQAGMRSNGTLGQLSELDRVSLSMMQENEVTTDSERVKAMARKTGLKPSDIVNAYRKNVENATFVLPSTRKALARYKQAATNMNGNFSPQELQRRKEEFQSAQGELMLSETYSGATAGMDERTQRQYNQQFLPQNLSKEGRARIEETIGAAAASNQAVRPGDETNSQVAQMSKLSNELFKTMQSDLNNTAEATGRFTAKINELIKAYQTGDQKAIAEHSKFLNSVGQKASNQTQAGTGGPGQ